MVQASMELNSKVEHFMNPNPDGNLHGYFIRNYRGCDNYWCHLTPILSGRTQKSTEK